MGRAAPAWMLGSVLLAIVGGCEPGVLDPESRPVALIEVGPQPALVESESTLQLEATLRDAQGNALPQRSVFWASEDTTIASVSRSGLVTGRSAGTVRIAASAEGVDALVTVTVVPRAVHSVALSPPQASLRVGETVRLEASARDRTGQPLNGRVVSWASSDPSVASVDAGGQVTGVRAGASTITATIEGRSATASVTVEAPPPVPVASVTISPTSATLQVGGTRQFTATAHAADGTPLPDRPITWTSSAPAVATVSATGLVTAVAPGQATITASAEGQSATASVTVEAPPPPRPTTLVLVSGNNQEGANNRALADPLVVRVLDQYGQPLAGVTVRWSAGNGSVSPETVETGSTGEASTTWTLGGGGPGPRYAWAEVEGLPRVEFVATRP
jgi:trimeric autotransporter adhesin